jgi:uncharacterized protein (TIGR02284 family)
MNTQEIIEKLNSLIQLDVDAVGAYEQAIQRIDAPLIRSEIIRFQGDHKRHITDLSDLVQRLGGKPIETSPDLEGFLIEGFTALRSITGTEGALKAMKGNEELTNKRYEDALHLVGLPDDVLNVIRRNRGDERRHLTYIERSLEEML